MLVVHGGFGYGSRSQEGEDVLNFALAYDLLIANTVFKKRESHLVTFRSCRYPVTGIPTLTAAR